MADTIRRQIGLYLTEVARQMPGNRGGARYGQPFDFAGTEHPYDWCFSGPEDIEATGFKQMRSRMSFIVCRVFRCGGERGSLHDVGEPLLGEMLQYYGWDQEQRAASTQPSLEFIALPEQAGIQALAEDHVMDAQESSTYGCVLLVLAVEFEWSWTDPFSQVVS